jgi:hypothetical protein
MSLSPSGVRGRNVTPGQPGQLRSQFRAVALDDEHVGSTAFVQVGGVAVLHVQRVSGDHHVGQRESVQQCGECGDLVGLSSTSLCPNTLPAAVVKGREQVRGPTVDPARSAGGLTVDRDRPRE